MSEKAANAAGAGEEQFEKTLQGIEARTQQLQTSLQNLYTSAGLEELYGNLLSIGTSILDYYNNISAAVGGGITGAIAAVGTFAGQFANLALVVTNVLRIIKTKERTFEQIFTTEYQNEINIRKNANISATEEANAIRKADTAKVESEITVDTIKNINKRAEAAKKAVKLSNAQKAGMGFAAAGLLTTGLSSVVSENQRVQGAMNAGGSLLSGISTGLMMPGPIWLKLLTGLATSLPGVISGISDLFTYTDEYTEKLDKAKKAQEEYNKALEESQKQTSYAKNLRIEVNSLKEVTASRNDSVEAYQQYLDKMNEISANYPELISYYDAEGNAILKNQEYLEKYTKEKEKAAKQAALDVAIQAFGVDDELLKISQQSYKVKQAKGVGSKAVTTGSEVRKRLDVALSELDAETLSILDVLKKANGIFSKYANSGADVTEEELAQWFGYEDVTSISDEEIIKNIKGANYTGDFGNAIALNTIEAELEDRIIKAYNKWISEGKADKDFDILDAYDTAMTEIMTFNGKTLYDAQTSYYRDYLLAYRKEILSNERKNSVEGKITTVAQAAANNYNFNSDLEKLAFQQKVEEQLNTAVQQGLINISDNSEQAQQQVQNIINEVSADESIAEFLNNYYEGASEKVRDILNKEILPNLTSYSKKELKDQLTKLHLSDTSGVGKTLIKQWDSDAEDSFKLFDENVKEWSQIIEINDELFKDVFTITDLVKFSTELTSLKHRANSLGDNYEDAVKAQYEFWNYLAQLAENNPEQYSTVQKAIKEYGTNTLTGLAQLKFKFSENTEFVNLLNELEEYLNVTVLTEYESFTKNFKSQLEILSDALSKATNGMSVDEAINMVEQLDISLDQFDFINGKYYYNNLELISQKYIANYNEILTAIDQYYEDAINKEENADKKKALEQAYASAHKGVQDSLDYLIAARYLEAGRIGKFLTKTGVGINESSLRASLAQGKVPDELQTYSKELIDWYNSLGDDVYKAFMDSLSNGEATTITVTASNQELLEKLGVTGKIGEQAIVNFANATIDDIEKLYDIILNDAAISPKEKTSYLSSLDDEITGRNKTNIFKEIVNSYSSFDRELAEKYAKAVGTTIDALGLEFNDTTRTFSMTVTQLQEQLDEKIRAGADAQSIKEIEDAIQEIYSSIADLIVNGLKGSLSNLDSQHLFTQAEALGIKLDFTETNKGLRISVDSAIALYNELVKIDRVAASLIFEGIKDQLTASGEACTNISATMVAIAKTEKEIKANTGSTNKELQNRLSIYKRIAAAQMDEASQYQFMNRSLPGSMQSPINFYESVGSMYSTMKDAAKNQYMEFEDFSRIVMEMNTWATEDNPITFMGETLNGSLTTAAALIEKGADAWTTVDGKLVVDFKKFGEGFKFSAEDASSDVQSGIKAFAKSQTDILDSLINYLEVVVAMEQLEMPEGGNWGQIFDEEQNDAMDEYAKKLLALADTSTEAGKEFHNALTSIYLDTEKSVTLYDVLANPFDGKWTDEIKQSFINGMTEFEKLIKDGTWDSESVAAIEEKLKAVKAAFGLGEENKEEDTGIKIKFEVDTEGIKKEDLTKIEDLNKLFESLGMTYGNGTISLPTESGSVDLGFSLTKVDDKIILNLRGKNGAIISTYSGQGTLSDWVKDNLQKYIKMQYPEFSGTAEIKLDTIAGKTFISSSEGGINYNLKLEGVNSSEDYKLPDGTTTSDVATFIKAWTDLAKSDTDEYNTLNFEGKATFENGQWKLNINKYNFVGDGGVDYSFTLTSSATGVYTSPAGNKNTLIEALEAWKTYIQGNTDLYKKYKLINLTADANGNVQLDGKYITEKGNIDYNFIITKNVDGTYQTPYGPTDSLDNALRQYALFAQEKAAQFAQYDFGAGVGVSVDDNGNIQLETRKITENGQINYSFNLTKKTDGTYETPSGIAESLGQALDRWKTWIDTKNTEFTQWMDANGFKKGDVLNVTANGNTITASIPLYTRADGYKINYSLTASEGEFKSKWNGKENQDAYQGAKAWIESKSSDSAFMAGLTGTGLEITGNTITFTGINVGGTLPINYQVNVDFTGKTPSEVAAAIDVQVQAANTLINKYNEFQQYAAEHGMTEAPSFNIYAGLGIKILDDGAIAITNPPEDWKGGTVFSSLDSLYTAIKNHYGADAFTPITIEDKKLFDRNSIDIDASLTVNVNGKVTINSEIEELNGTYDSYALAAAAVEEYKAKIKALNEETNSLDNDDLSFSLKQKELEWAAQHAGENAAYEGDYNQFLENQKNYNAYQKAIEDGSTLNPPSSTSEKPPKSYSTSTPIYNSPLELLRQYNKFLDSKNSNNNENTNTTIQQIEDSVENIEKDVEKGEKRESVEEITSNNNTNLQNTSEEWKIIEKDLLNYYNELFYTKYPKDFENEKSKVESGTASEKLAFAVKQYEVTQEIIQAIQALVANGGYEPTENTDDITDPVAKAIRETNLVESILNGADVNEAIQTAITELTQSEDSNAQAAADYLSNLVTNESSSLVKLTTLINKTRLPYTPSQFRDALEGISIHGDLFDGGWQIVTSDGNGGNTHEKFTAQSLSEHFNNLYHKLFKKGQAKGNVALAKGKNTLMGELGPELWVAGGRYYVAGQNGAEFVNLPDDAIVFNHLQTKRLLGSGSTGRGKPVTNERNAVSYAKGTGPAMASASDTLTYLKALRSLWDNIANKGISDLTKAAGGGGGGSSKETKQFLYDLDRWYNLLRQISKVEEQISYQQKRRENLAHGGDYIRSLEYELALLKKEAANYKQLSSLQKSYYDARRKDQEASIYSYFFRYDEDGLMQTQDEGFKLLAGLNRTDTAGVALYSEEQQISAITKALNLAGFDETQIKQELYYNTAGEELTEAADIIQNFYDKYDGWVEEMDSTYDSYTEYMTKYEELITDQNKILEEYRDIQLDVENQLLDAVVNRQQAIIDNQQDELDALRDASDKYIDGLNDALNKERQMYERSQDAQELDQLQRRLAILQRSGGSASSIRSLQEQIDSKMKDAYFQEQQDQIDAIKEASDKEIEMMQAQIDLMTETLEYQKENGLLWEEVSEMMSKWTPEQLSQFMKENTNDFKSFSTEQQTKTLEEWALGFQKWEGIKNAIVANKVFNRMISADVLEGLGIDVKNNPQAVEAAIAAASTAFNNYLKDNLTGTISSEELENTIKDAIQAAKQAVVDDPGLHPTSPANIDSIIASATGSGSGAGATSASSGDDLYYYDIGDGKGFAQFATLDHIRKNFPKAKIGGIAVKRSENNSTTTSTTTSTPSTTSSAETTTESSGLLLAKDAVQNKAYWYYDKAGFKDSTKGLQLKYASSIQQTGIAGPDTPVFETPDAFYAWWNANKHLYGYSAGGLNTQPGFAMLHGTQDKPEAVLNATQTKILKEDILGNSKDSFMSLLLNFNRIFDGIGQTSTYNGVEKNNSSLVIENATVNMNVQSIANDYDARRAGETALDEMLKIARKTTVQTMGR